MPEINSRWSFLAVSCLVLALALVLSKTLDARPTVRLPFTKVSSLAEISAQLRGELLRTSNQIHGIGYPKIDQVTEEVIEGAIASLPEETRIIVGGNLHISRPHDSVDLLRPETLDHLIDQIPSWTNVVIILPSIFISHRMGKNWLTEFESESHRKISSTILAEIALKSADEENLSPKCYTSQRTVDAQTYDLGCLILRLSRSVPVDFLPRGAWQKVDGHLLVIEDELPNESILSYSAAGGTP